ncbi:MAG TPA: c-type cytochrome, partial [Chromatiales bacterium]|nr:c-type cytochrome [Chromatiales bacterium]
SGFDAFERLQASKQVVNIARYPGNTGAGRRVYGKECAGCHGADGEGDPARLIPPLVGQYSEYLFRQINRFRKGERIHDDPRDAEIFRSFSDTEIRDILAWLSIQDDA